VHETRVEAERQSTLIHRVHRCLNENEQSDSVKMNRHKIFYMRSDHQSNTKVRIHLLIMLMMSGTRDAQLMGKSQIAFPQSEASAAAMVAICTRMYP